MLSRRSFLGAAAAPLAGAAPPPNVLFISVDDMNDWVGCLGGYPGVRTPNIDRMAARGALFSNAHCASPLCNPSRTALLTGMRPTTTGVYGNEQWWRPALPNAVTLPMHFRRNGYYAAGAGKVFHHVAGFNPPDQWDEFQLQVFDDPWYRRTEWYPWVKKIPNPPGHPFNGLQNFQGEFDWGVLDKPESEYGDFKAVQWASDFLKKKQEKPFFLAVGLWHPHIPMFAPKKYFDMYPDPRLPEVPENDLDDVPPIGKRLAAARIEEHDRIFKEGKWRDAVRAYLASISFADALIGRLLAALETSAYANNTVIVLWSDNGWHLGEKQHWHKSTLWERATHVPLLMAGTGVKSPGVTRTQPVSLLDIYPTLVELCGLPRRAELEGESLAPLLANPKAPHKPVVSTFEPGNHAVRDERWRYIRYRDGTEELYDRHADANEYRNIAGDARYDGVKASLARYLPAKSAPQVPVRADYDFDFATHTWRRK
ncbi:MAG: sulfatase [Candidatus Solibacter usitatus]|nr:sulfatase [Candidatus Solibacter usitatus]